MDLEIGLGVTNMKEVWLIRSIGLPSPALVNQYLNVLVLLEEDLVGVAGTGFSDSLEEITVLFLFLIFIYTIHFRVILDRCTSDLDDMWSSLDFTIHEPKREASNSNTTATNSTPVKKEWYEPANCQFI